MEKRKREIPMPPEFLPIFPFPFVQQQPEMESTTAISSYSKKRSLRDIMFLVNESHKRDYLRFGRSADDRHRFSDRVTTRLSNERCHFRKPKGRCVSER
jgi:hypothetical protein